MKWEELKLDVPSGTMELAVTDELVDEFIEAMEMTDPRFARPREKHKLRLAPPHLAPKIGLDPLYIDFLQDHIGTGVFAKQHFKFFAPTWVGDTVSGRGRFVDKFEARDKRFVVFAGEFRNQDDVLLVREHRTIMVVSPTFRIKGQEAA